ncbi:MAG: GTPase ObgE [Ignavibacteria bacterium]|nr:GTPase ObgE [Ignavibacteria bacterium]MDP3832297.1 GTPase ObgE [Ignavibacteriaceae bacterium]
MFIDYVEIEIKAGKGGDGAVTFRREKYVPKGGPSGGNGGNGGNVILQTDNNLYTLLDFNYKSKYHAQPGAPGANSLKDGKTGDDVIIKIPVGTIIKNLESDEIIVDLDEPGMNYVIAKGGRGGKGNSNFATPTNQAPRFAEKGKLGDELKVGLELKLIADIGLVGFPNAGKSTFISVISAAKPKIADYPFTTLEPNLGIVRYKDYKSFTVADIPGIIEGASEGKGLGLQFLRHIERTRILLFLIDITSENPQKEFDILINELKTYSPMLVKKKKIIALSKADLVEDEIIKKLKKKKFRKADSSTYVISAVSGFGVAELLDVAWKTIQEL